MPRSKAYSKAAWYDRFNTPSIEALRSGLPSRMTHVFDRVRRAIRQLDDVEEVVVWHGDCWHWTIEYRAKQGESPLAILVPCPSDLQLAMPLDPEFAELLSKRRLKRAVRDGLELAREPFNSNWAVWSVTAVNMLADLFDLIERKFHYMARRAG